MAEVCQYGGEPKADGTHQCVCNIPTTKYRAKIKASYQTFYSSFMGGRITCHRYASTTTELIQDELSCGTPYMEGGYGLNDDAMCFVWPTNISFSKGKNCQGSGHTVEINGTRVDGVWDAFLGQQNEDFKGSFSLNSYTENPIEQGIYEFELVIK